MVFMSITLFQKKKIKIFPNLRFSIFLMLGCQRNKKSHRYRPETGDQKRGQKPELFTFSASNTKNSYLDHAEPELIDARHLVLYGEKTVLDI